MAKPARLKVFHTPVGFDDAYVAAASRKAALVAWGSRHDLFATGDAELVEDPALTAEALATPGTVIRKRRGSAEDRAALRAHRPTPPPPSALPKRAEPKSQPKPNARPPRPEDSAVAAAHAALRDTERTQATAAHDFAAREAALARERAAFERDAAKALQASRADLARATARFEATMARWERAARAP